MKIERSSELFKKAKELIPGGVNSPVRAAKAVDAEPLFIQKGQGCYIWDADGNRYIDYVCSWGPLILGHAYPAVLEAIKEVIQNGTSFGAPTELEVKMAEMITEMIPSVEMVRMVNSGTEATMSAIRLARAYTGREKIIKFDGCYHGHSDSLLVAAGSGVATFGIPGSPGIPEDIAKHTISLPYNNLSSVKEVFDRIGNQIAAVIVEPIAGNMGVVLPEDGFLKGLRDITERYGALLIFDEVITGFRVSSGGAQQLFGIQPDLTCLGKIIGGGFPVGAYGGKKEIMRHISPEGDVYQAGTLSGNPVAMAAGVATLRVLKDKSVYQELERKGKILFDGIKEKAKEKGIAVTVNWIGSMGSVFFTDQKVTDFNSVKKSDTDKFKKFYKEMLSNGIYLAPSPFEAIFVSYAHTDEALEYTVEAAAHAFEML
ncbi:MAG: glutamate-1-semialdehyde-2,1-aminomutase [Deltaproteobacteria bacterium]|nr:MAG: glutamate-1-semialdehyde-2,1-aminomutase [Deltaproteobacteria bacterium]